MVEQNLALHNIGNFAHRLGEIIPWNSITDSLVKLYDGWTASTVGTSKFCILFLFLCSLLGKNGGGRKEEGLGLIMCVVIAGVQFTSPDGKSMVQYFPAYPQVVEPPFDKPPCKGCELPKRKS